jgi:hypothetical protein
VKRKQRIMAKFCRLTLVIIAVLTAPAGVARLIGVARPVQDPVLSFGLAHCVDGLPCFRDVTPGRTSWSEAQAAFASLGDTEISSPMTFTMRGPYGHVVYSRSLDQTAVGVIFIDVPVETRLPLGEFIEEYGPPCEIGIKTYRAYYSFTLYYPQLYAELQTADGLTMNASLRQIGFYDPASLSGLMKDTCPHEDPLMAYFDRPSFYSPWKGFASISHYLARR